MYICHIFTRTLLPDLSIHPIRLCGLCISTEDGEENVQAVQKRGEAFRTEEKQLCLVPSKAKNSAWSHTGELIQPLCWLLQFQLALCRYACQSVIAAIMVTAPEPISLLVISIWFGCFPVIILKCILHQVSLLQ